MTGDQGVNAVSGTYEDLVKSGVIDPAKVARFAVQNAASISSLLPTTDAMASEHTEEASPEPPPEGTGFHHGGHA